MGLNTPKYLCPHCAEPGLSALRRSYLGPAVPARCTACGNKIGIPYGRSVVATIPFLVAIMFTPLVIFEPLAVAALITCGAIVMFALFYRWVPLEKR